MDPQPRCHFHGTGLGSSHFARRYSGNHSLFSSPQGTEMFHFPWFAPSALCIQAEVTRLSPRWVSPFGHLRLNVRLATPRSFSQPPTSFFASWHLGIHRTPLVAYLPESLMSPPHGRLPFSRPGPRPRLFVADPENTSLELVCRDSPPGCSRSTRGLLAFTPRTSQQKLISTLRMHLSKNASLYFRENLCGADRDRTDDIQLGKLTFYL